MYVLSWRTVSALTVVLFWCLFPLLLRNSWNKHKNNPLVSAETVPHSSAYIILYLSDKWSTFASVVLYGQNGGHFQMHFLEWKCMNFKEDSTEFYFPKGLINNIPILVQIMTWNQSDNKPLSEPTRTTRTPAFWGYPPPTHDYSYYWAVHFGSQVKRRQSQSYKFKEFAKTYNFLFLKKKKTLHATHPLKLLDEECKYEMDPESNVEDTERTRFCPQMYRRRARQGEIQHTPLQLL